MVDTFKSLLGFDTSILTANHDTTTTREPLLNGQQQQSSSSSSFYPKIHNNHNNHVNDSTSQQQQPSSASSLSSSTLLTSSSSINSTYLNPTATTTKISNRSNGSSNQSYDFIDPNNGSSRNSSRQNNGNGGGGKITWIMGAFLLINAALGAGLLNYPVAYDRLGGIVYATIIQMFAAVLMMTTILILIYCAQINNEDSYHGVMRTMCGPRVMRISAASIAITCFGICVTFVIIIGDQFDRIFATYIGREFCRYWWANRFFTMSITAIMVTWPMCYFRRLDFLRHINVLGVIASFYIIFLNIYSYYNHERDPFHTYEIRTSPESALEFIAALPVVFFAYQTHEIVIPVYDSMSEKNIQNFSKSILVSMASLLVLYCLAGSFGYLTFGSNVAPDIMLMYNANDPIVLAGIVALIVKMITTYPPVVFCGRDTIVRIVLSRYYGQQYRSGYECISSDDNGGIESPENTFERYERRWNIIITTIWNVAVLVLAIVIPNITIAIGFLGSLASCNVFIFPGIALFSLIKRYRKFGHQHQQQSKFIDNTTSVQLPVQYGVVMDDDDDDEIDTITNQTRRSSWFTNWFNLQKQWLQNILQAYALFIIMMGIIMFIIILIQVYHDFQQQSEHGAVCDLVSMIQNKNTNNTTATTTTTTSASASTSSNSSNYIS